LQGGGGHGGLVSEWSADVCSSDLFGQFVLLAPPSGMGNSVFHPCDYAILSGSVDKDRMGRAFALHTFSGNLGFALAPPVMALLEIGRASCRERGEVWRGGV